MQRLLEDDVLELGPRVGERMLERGFLLDPERALYRTLARVAYSAAKYDGVPSLSLWLRGRIDAALEEIVAEDREEERAALPLPVEGDERFAFLTRSLAIEPADARRAATQFNVLDEKTRISFVRLAIVGNTFHRVVAEGLGPPDALRARVRRAAETLGLPPDGLDDLLEVRRG